MNKNEVKKIVLETILEVLDDMSYYPSEGDTLYGSLKDEMHLKLEKLEKGGEVK